MDPATIAAISGLVEKSGPVTLFFALLIAFKAGRVAVEAVKALTDIRDQLTKNQPLLQQIAIDVDEVKKSNAGIDARVTSSDMKLAALVARRSG